LTAEHALQPFARGWLAARVQEMVADGRRSPGTFETYERQLRNHVLPAIGEVRLGEVSTPLVDKVIGAITTVDDHVLSTGRTPRRRLGPPTRAGAVT
jgi:hypothetical protein